MRKEVGTFIYFDESDWLKRIKDDVEMDLALVENEVSLPNLERED